MVIRTSSRSRHDVDVEKGDHLTPVDPDIDQLVGERLLDLWIVEPVTAAHDLLDDVELLARLTCDAHRGDRQAGSNLLAEPSVGVHDHLLAEAMDHLVERIFGDEPL
jgi:hypothetical protein